MKVALLSPAPSELRHATTVAIDGRGVLIEGPSGAGKSDLALRLIDRGAVLVADDRTLVVAAGGGLRARCPLPIAGLIEVRGLGPVPVAHRDDVPVALLVTLGDPDRLPRPRVGNIVGLEVRAIVLDPRPAAAPILVELALAHPELPPP